MSFQELKKMTLRGHKIVYLISEELDYGLLICDDAGPGYARSMNWFHDGFANLANYLDEEHVIITDPRLSETEYRQLYEAVRQHPSVQFIAVVTDPCFEECIDKPLYKFLFRTTTLPNIVYLSQYHPTEIVAFLRNIKGSDAMLTLPYPYQKEKESQRPFTGRKNKILFSGSLARLMYPDRFRFYRKYRRSFWRLKVDTLFHPGYPGKGQKFSHSYVGKSYIERLSEYRFMYLDGSRCNLELMKYSECAYAGCVPVGRAPETFHPELRKLVLPIDNRRMTRSLLNIFSMPENELAEIARAYRAEFERTRNLSVLTKNFESFLQTTCALHTSPTSIL